MKVKDMKEIEKCRELTEEEDKSFIWKETRRYLGLGAKEGDSMTEELISQCLKDLESTAAPKWAVKEFPLKIQGDRIYTEGFSTESKSLLKNLAGCEKVIIFAATLGTGVDHLIRRYEKIQMSRAVVLQAAAAAWIEEFCNRKNRMLKEAYEKEGWFLRPRFSPGYGDFPLECQQSILTVLEAGKRIGLTLTDSMLMAPSKSVSAVIGVGRQPVNCRLEGCESCDKSDCQFRRSKE